MCRLQVEKLQTKLEVYFRRRVEMALLFNYFFKKNAFKTLLSKLNFKRHLTLILGSPFLVPFLSQIGLSAQAPTDPSSIDFDT